MFAYFRKKENQKDLFFQLNSVLTLDRSEQKLKGVYIIFKDDNCLYVGQSTNIGSRLATHLSGKFKEATKILIYEVDIDGICLTENEKYCIKHFKPQENILVDYDEKLDISKLLCVFQDISLGGDADIKDYVEFSLNIKGKYIFAYSADILPELYEIDKDSRELMLDPLNAGNKYA